MSLQLASAALSDDYSQLHAAGRAAVQAGDLPRALDAFDAALRWAREYGDQTLEDRAFCNVSLVQIELGSAQGAVGGLRQILVRNQDDENCWLASYHVARAFELDKEFKKALFYSRIALERARKLERADWVASSHNLLGDLLLAECFTEQATEEYETALELLDEQISVRRGQILDNLGYCRILQHSYGEGFELLGRSLDLLEEFSADRYLASTHLDLCFAHLEVDQYRDSIQHGHRALELASEYMLLDSIKNSLYLIGQAEWLAGNQETARSHYRELERLFPGTPGLTELLVTFDIRQLINLRA